MLSSRIRGSRLICLSGPTGSGKTSIATELVARFQGSVRRSVSATSRAPRPGEVHGQSYFFLSPQEFEQKITADDFYEWEKVHQTYYGTPRDEVRRALEGGHDLILTIDIRGALRVRKELPDQSSIIFLTPPDCDALLERVQKRGAMDPVELKTRLHTAVNEYEALLAGGAPGAPIDYIVVNDSFERAVSTVASIISSERQRAKDVLPEFRALIANIQAALKQKIH